MGKYLELKRYMAKLEGKIFLVLFPGAFIILIVGYIQLIRMDSMYLNSDEQVKLLKSTILVTTISYLAVLLIIYNIVIPILDSLKGVK